MELVLKEQPLYELSLFKEQFSRHGQLQSYIMEQLYYEVAITGSLMGGIMAVLQIPNPLYHMLSINKSFRCWVFKKNFSSSASFPVIEP